MGVQGLLSVCLERQDECTEPADLVHIAQQRDGIDLIVDFYSFQHQIVYKFWTGLSALRGNPYLRILGGEYGSLDRYVTKLIGDLKSLGINLVFFVDGAKGSSTEALRQKLDTWIKRHDQDIERMSLVLDVFRGKINIDDLDVETNIRPVALEDQFVAAIKKCGCEFYQIPAGEADLLLIRALKDREKAYAILSNDSDFCVFPGSRFIPVQLFDIENDLQLGQPVEVPENPVRLKVKVITTEKVMAMLQLSNHNMFVEMSIACGNDFTGPFMRGPHGYHSRLDVRGRKNVENISGWIRHYKNIQNHPLLSKEMHHNRQFRDAVYFSRNFYNVRGEPDTPPRKGYYSQLIEERIRSGEYPSNIMSMHNNFYWYRMLLEDNSHGQPCSESALTPLRAYIYRILLPRHEHLVNEYGRSPYENMRKAGIIAVEEGSVPSLHRIIPDKIFDNLRNFHAIMSHQERGNCSTNWFDRYGRKNGFIVYLLRYFLWENWGQNLHLSENEYLALVAMAFSKAKEVGYQKLVIRPTVRCVTIGNWFLDLYRHAYSMLGSLFHLKHEFPLPAEIFCGSVWTAMYMVCEDQSFRIAASQVPVQELYKVQETMNTVIKEKRHMIRHFVEGFFPFDDR